MLGSIDLPLKAATEFANAAAEKDWKWFCMFLFILCALGSLAVIIYLFRKNEQYSTRLHTAFEANTAATIKLAETLGINSTIIADAKTTVGAASKQIERNENLLRQLEEEIRRRPRGA